jgi:tripartite-type tricarboxylate transporter receptor subunit TctC
MASTRVASIHRLAALSVAMIAGCTAPCAAQSDPVADFYRGKTVTMLIGVGVGGEYDLQARLVAKYMGRHLPGQPNVVPQNMTGASGLKMLNYLYNQAPRDGTSIGMIQNGFPAAEAIGRPGIQFDSNQLRWLGTIAPVVETMALWHTAGIGSIDDARKKETVIGATARGGITFTYPALMNELLGTKFKIVTGYTGGNEINIAMERGEVQGRNNSWSSWKVTKQPWLKERKLLVIAQAGAKAKDLDAPMIEELTKSQADRQLVDLIMSGAALGRPMATTPGVPEPRLAALRAAFLAVMKDPDFVKETAALNIDIEPVSGDAMQKIVANVLATPKAVAERAKPLLE